MSWLDWIKEKGYDFINLLRTTPIEVAIVGALGLGIGICGSYSNEKSRERLLPLAFSERGQILRDIRYGESQVKELGPFADYLTAANDAAMKIAEAWNRAHDHVFADPMEEFAFELDISMNKSEKIYHDTLPELLDQLPVLADKALSEFQDFVDVQQKISEVNHYFDTAWDDDHDDVYHTEIDTEEVCTTSYDSEGNSSESCHLETTYRQVYDYTIHTYTYDQITGEKADTALEALLAKHPELKFKEVLPVPTQTNADGEYAAETSGAMESCPEEIEKQECLMQIATSWNFGSTLKSNLGTVESSYSALPKDKLVWARSKNKAESTSYITYSHFDDGPEEYQDAERALNHGRNIESGIGQIVGGINYAKNNAPQMKKTIEQFISSKDSESGVGDDQGEAIIESAKEMYRLNFKEGQDFDRFRWYMVLVWGLAGATAGAGIGFLLDYLGNTRGWYEQTISSFRRRREDYFGRRGSFDRGDYY